MLLYYLCACKEYSCLFVHALFVDCIDIGIDPVIRLCVIVVSCQWVSVVDHFLWLGEG